MTRISFDEWAMQIAQATAQRSTCFKKSVGAVIVSPDRKVVGLGYNGSPTGIPNCLDIGCMVCDMKNPESRFYCNAVHAEANAILQAGDKVKGSTMYVTHFPCRECVKLIINSGITAIVYAEPWRLMDDGEWSPVKLLQTVGIGITQYKGGKTCN